MNSSEKKDSSTFSEDPEPVSFKQAVCLCLGCGEDQYERQVFRRVMTRRARLVGFFISWFYPEFHFQERLLIRQAGQAQSLKEIQLDIDFYRHKYVVSSKRRDNFGLRLSGKRLMRFARKVFASVQQ